MKTAVIYDDVYLKHDLPSHPENALRLKYFMEPVYELGIPILKPKQVSYELLTAVHEESYVQDVIISCRERAPGFFDPDTYYNSFTCDSALMAAGANEFGVELLLEGKYEAVFCAVRPPGHHAERNRAMGFCIFNNVAISALKALSMGVEKVFIVDFDAHHGNGTQHAFYDEERVFYFSTHQYPFYPGTGSVSENNSHVLNVPMAEGSSDREFLEVYSTLFKRAVEDFSPEIILVSAGYDLHEDDPLTDLKVSDRGVEGIVTEIVDSALSLGVPLLFTLEGGYNLNALRRCSSITFKLLIHS
ncbi:acetoin utilization deacetylase AcuC-like enzyme [Thermovibrio guaymasensis]|uniref:Acetoin utilization deacetylase AcuC-like enzyme n=1 Tax=Thermovibrio guaymasensis TaxID=240167 RepID=A0A420W873_9BACT|nr:histone deacetylase [Thermovibrio guaymasensis]RKQ63506.1 acetoin utilization deacetylase AcuC-like enzyme [Thermovibrio guaymasensis]